MVTLSIFIPTLLILSGVSKAVTNTLSHHFGGSVFKTHPEIWNPEITSTYKYKPGTKEPKYFGSTTFLVWTTDMWHLFDMLHLTFLQSAGILPVMVFYKLDWWWFLMLLIGAKLLCSGSFEVCYSRLFIKK